MIIYDDYYETNRGKEEVQSLYADYLIWCIENKQEPEVESMEFVNEENIGHIAYHAKIQRNKSCFSICPNCGIESLGKSCPVCIGRAG